MATKSKRKAKSTLKKIHKGYIVIAVITLIVGAVIGYGAASFMFGSDTLAVKGQKTVTVDAGQTVVYTDEGIVYVSGGKDMSDKYEITDTNMSKLASGEYTGVVTAENELYIIYTVTEGRAAGQTVYRVFIADNAGGGNA